MPLTKTELLIAAEAAERYPKGHAMQYFWDDGYTDGCYNGPFWDTLPEAIQSGKLSLEHG